MKPVKLQALGILIAHRTKFKLHASDKGSFEGLQNQPGPAVMALSHLEDDKDVEAGTVF